MFVFRSTELTVYDFVPWTEAYVWEWNNVNNNTYNVQVYFNSHMRIVDQIMGII